MARGGARPGAGRRAGARELAGEIREALRAAIDQSAAAGFPLKILLMRAMRREPLKFLEVLSRFVPKDLTIENSRAPFDELTDQELDAVLAEARRLAEVQAGDAPKRGSKKSKTPQIH